MIPNILVIDDDKFHLCQIKRELKQHASVIPMFPQELMDKKDISFFAKIHLALIDYDFKKFTSLDAEVAPFLRKMGCKSPILLCSLHNDFGDMSSEVNKQYNGIIDKEKLNWEYLRPYLSYN